MTSEKEETFDQYIHIENKYNEKDMKTIIDLYIERKYTVDVLLSEILENSKNENMDERYDVLRLALLETFISFVNCYKEKKYDDTSKNKKKESKDEKSCEKEDVSKDETSCEKEDASKNEKPRENKKSPTEEMKEILYAMYELDCKCGIDDENDIDELLKDKKKFRTILSSIMKKFTGIKLQFLLTFANLIFVFNGYPGPARSDPLEALRDSLGISDLFEELVEEIRNS